MNVLFLHPNFPAQFRHLAFLLGRDPKNKVVFGTTRREGDIPGVRKVVYEPHRTPGTATHHYLRFLEAGVLQGQAVARLASTLRSEGFAPDIVYGHSGWGPMLFVRDVFPQARCLCYFEWFYNAAGSDVGFDPDVEVKPDAVLKLRMKNTPILTDLYSCDRGLSPTFWQRQQFPGEFRNKISVVHDGVDTGYFQPKQGAGLVLPSIGLDLPGGTEIVTYVARGMEPYRGFPQFMEAVAMLQESRPECHLVIVGRDEVHYGPRPPEGKTFKQIACEKLSPDLSRIHFTDHLSYPDYLKVLQASSVHVYLTYPFVLSWSMLEAMSAGCLIVASNTAPVTEVIEDGRNGLLVDFFSPKEIAERVEEALENPRRMEPVRQAARRTIINSYNLATLLPLQLRWMTG